MDYRRLRDVKRGRKEEEEATREKGEDVEYFWQRRQTKKKTDLLLDYCNSRLPWWLRL